MKVMMRVLIGIAAAFATCTLASEYASAIVVDDVKVTILSDMVPGRRTHAEWGFAAFVEVKSGGVTRHILFDTGGMADTVVKNAKIIKTLTGELAIDFAKFQNGEVDIVLSHNHSDHTSGLMTLLDTYPKAFGLIHVGPGIFAPRRSCKAFDAERNCVSLVDGEKNSMVGVKAAFIQKYGESEFQRRFVVHEKFEAIAAGVYVTGAIPRVTSEDNNAGNNFALYNANGPSPYDRVAEEISLAVVTPNGPVVITGCAHAGIINTLTAVRDNLKSTSVDALIGGLHLLAHKTDELKWTAANLSAFTVKHFIASHCTGLERLAFLRAHVAGMQEDTAVFGAVETSYSYSKGISHPEPSITKPIEK